jgi:hypothetical protein
MRAYFGDKLKKDQYFKPNRYFFLGALATTAPPKARRAKAEATFLTPVMGASIYFRAWLTAEIEPIRSATTLHQHVSGAIRRALS